MPNYKSSTVRFAQIILKAQELRGKILEETTYIEFILDLIILKYFCESTEKIELFSATLLNQTYISLNSKIKTFKNLSLGGRYEELIKKLSKDLKKIKDKRNEFAHCMIDSSEDAINDGNLRLISYENGKKKSKQISEEYLSEYSLKLNDIKTELIDLLENGDFLRKTKIAITTN